MVKIEDTGLRPGMFILTEANGQRSRENAYIAQPATVQPGDFLTFSSAGTSDDPRAVYTALAGTDVDAIAIHGGVSASGDELEIAVLVRDAEVNGNALTWPANLTTRKAIIDKLATLGIIVRF